MKQGIYEKLSMEAYHAGPEVSKSQLDRLAKSPMHFLTPMKQTAPMKFGSLVHTAVLEPYELLFRYRMNDLNRNTKAYKAAAAEAELECEILVKSAEMDYALAIQRAVHAHPTASKLLTGGVAESSAYAEIDGVMCRCRPDYVNEKLSVMVDLKSTTDASPSEFAKACGRYRYHVQEAFYRDVYLAAGGFSVDAFVFIAVEKEPPHAIGVYELTVSDVLAGREKYRQNLETYKRCRDANEWPGYEPGIVEISLPEWSL